MPALFSRIQSMRESLADVATKVEIVVKQFEATNERDFAAAMDGYAEDVTLVVHGWMSGDETAIGKADVGEWFGDWFRQFGADYQFEIEESRGSGDHVFLVAAHHGQGRASGVPVAGSSAYLYTVRDGKITRVEMWFDRETAPADFRD
jgi:ketosteroid isomerase-like protein